MSVMKLRQIVPLAGIVVLSVAVFAQGPRRDGRWEVTTQMEMAGMPAGRGMPPMTTTQCITKEQAEDPQKMVPQPPARGGQQNDCKVSDFKTVGSKITWTVKCTTPQPVDGTGEVTYGNDTYEGQMNMNMTMARGGQSMPMQMTIKVNGKRLGDCAQ
jgi:hypothetical protein